MMPIRSIRLLMVCWIATLVAACTGDTKQDTGDPKASITELRDAIDGLPFDAAKSDYFFPGEFDVIRSAWVRAAENGVLDTIAEAHSNYLDLHARTSAIAWSSLFGGDGFEEASQVVVRPEGGYLVVADTTSFGAGQRDAFLVSIDADGNELERFTHGGEENDSVFAALVLEDGYVAAGRTSSFTDWTGDAYVFRTDAGGALRWEQHFGVSGTDSLECIFATDEGYLAAGNTFEGGGGRNIMLARFTPSGEIAEKAIVPGENDDWVNAGIRSDDGRIALAGGRGTLNAAVAQFLLLILSADGAVESQFTYDLAGVATTGLTGVAPAPDGGFYLLGQTMESLETSEDVVILRVAADGELAWSETMRADDAEYGAGVVAASDGGAVFAASTRSYGAGGSDILLVKYSDDGNEAWARTLGSAEDESAHAIAVTPDGGYIIAGERGTFIEGIQDLYVVKTCADGFSWMGMPLGTSDLEAAPEQEMPGGAAPMDMPEDTLEIGDEAPAFQASTWYNVPDALQRVFEPDAEIFAEKVGAPLIVLEFWATWCVPCKITIPHINELQAKYTDQGVVFVSLTDENAEQLPVEEFIRENDMKTIVGAGSPSGLPFGAWVIPHAYVIDQYGKILWFGHPMSGLDEAIEAGLHPDTSETITPADETSGGPS